MTELFHFNTLKVNLESNTKSLIVALNRPDFSHAINSEMILELETLFSWLAYHIEVNSVLITSTDCEGHVFSVGLDAQEMNKQTNEKLVKNLKKLQKLIYAMFFLPQTIIVDLKSFSRGHAMELSLGADIRIAREKSLLEFNHLNMGLVPSCGGVGFLSALVSHTYAKSWLLNSGPIPSEQLIASGFITEFYNENSNYAHYLESVASQSPVSRIQTKRSLLESILSELDKALEFEKKFALAGLSSQDWKKIIEQRGSGDVEFTSAKALGTLLKRNKERVN